jgi:hypothetical protein
MNPFFTSSINEFELVSNHINYMIEQYPQIRQFLKSNFSSEFHQLLAKPEKSGHAINWYTELTGEFKRIEDFPMSVRSNLINTYNARKHEVEATCAILNQSDDFDKQIWANILKSAFNPDHLFLFSNGKEILLVWGIKTNKQLDYLVPFDAYKSALLLATIEDVSANENDELNSTDINNIDDTENEVSEENLENQEVESVAMPTDFTDSPEIDTETSDSNSSEDKLSEQATLPPDDIEKPPSPSKKKHWFYSALDRFEIFAGKYWWLILIVLIILLWFLLDRCNKPVEQPRLSDNQVEEIYDEIMPEIPQKRIIPIDTSDFREDDNTGNIIVAGLLNIALVENKAVFKRMAVELKQQFPDEKYKIVYYDEETSRLQLNFPEDELANIKDKIREKLPRFELLMWDESVFQSNKKSNDPFFKDANKAWHMKAIHLEQAWDISMGDTSVCIAIIDDGFDLKHNEFKGKQIKSPYNVILDNKQVYANNSIIHGTHVAGLALANADNNAGASGVAPKCSFMPIQIGAGEEFFTMTDVVDGVLFALNHGADVINMSLGKQYAESVQGRSPSELEQIINNTGKDEEKFWKELFKLANKKNTMIVLAGGNEDLLIGLDPMQRSDEVLKVVAVDINMAKAGFSNYCKNWSAKNAYISAPGVGIYSSIPGNKFQSMQGTSMAAPIVTGAIALIKSVNPNLKNKEILKILRETSKPLADRSCPPFLQLDVALKKSKKH